MHMRSRYQISGNTLERGGLLYVVKHTAMNSRIKDESFGIQKF